MNLKEARILQSRLKKELAELIGELVARVIQLRQEMKYYRSMAMKPKREKGSSSFRDVSNTVLVTTIDHELAVQKSKQLTMECERLSLLIEKLDMETEVDCNIE